MSNLSSDNAAQYSDENTTMDTLTNIPVQYCTPSDLDTLDSNFSVKYLNRKKYFTIELKIGNVQKELSDARYRCDDPRTGVPRFNSYYKNWLCLKRGCGDHCVDYFLFNRVNDSINFFGGYEFAYDVDLINSYLIILNQENYKEILIIDYLANRCCSKKLIPGKSYDNILEFKFIDNKINVLYDDNTTQKVKFGKVDFIDALSKYPLSTKNIPIATFKRE